MPVPNPTAMLRRCPPWHSTARAVPSPHSHPTGEEHFRNTSARTETCTGLQQVLHHPSITPLFLGYSGREPAARPMHWCTHPCRIYGLVEEQKCISSIKLPKTSGMQLPLPNVCEYIQCMLMHAVQMSLCLCLQDKSLLHSLMYSRHPPRSENYKLDFPRSLKGRYTLNSDANVHGNIFKLQLFISGFGVEFCW